MRFQLIHCRHIILITLCLHQLVDCAETFCLHQYGTLACISFFSIFLGQNLLEIIPARDQAIPRRNKVFSSQGN